MAGLHALVAWQVAQSALVGTWLAGLPPAVVPLWQDEQLPLTALWSTLRTGAQALTAWQLSQRVVVGICVADRPVALVPLWQDEQLPLMPAWVKLAGDQPLV